MEYHNDKPSTSSNSVGADYSAIDFSKLDLDDVDDELIRQRLENQQDLRDYLKGIEDELKQVERLTVSDCIENADKVADLTQEIDECDGVLEVFK
jgi:predicted component of type VI protein secretion system